ncbi:unnamed protein product [Spirodela intermedia]|uniref:SAM-dependent MTase RsmB/NOP-type domain-containing protein n=1 Tax=Spirodela intermedia TaxID=51605 RepID=A0A7I8KVJ8_SPIIN|nr:unnamed protein product [Spirodela intermedia]
MGRGQKRGRTQRKHFKENRENLWKYSNDGDNRAGDVASQSNSHNPSWEPFNTENQAFEEYYKEQGIVSEEEWSKFISFLRKPLPAAFRINSSGQFYKDIQSQLENDFSKSLEADLGHEYETEPIRPLAWYPGNLAWHSNFSRMQLRKNQTLERFHEFLKLENEIGNITRQEAVSMVPPLFLDILPDHHVLDMCAAPGSKTFQLLEMMHQSSNVGLLPNGLVIANDVDVQRCNLLIHQTRRMCSANLIVTNHEAQHFPSCRLNTEIENGRLTSSSPSCLTEEAVTNQLLFDRVLCDVPCSGDGTLRKAPDIWRKWNSGMGNGLHRLQVQIAMRGLALLKVGGRMVYSTCSMNPVENEAVIAEILRRCGSTAELVDVSGELPQLIRRQGLKNWKVRDRGLWLHSYEDVPPARKGVILQSMFSPAQSSEDLGSSSSDVPVDTILAADTVEEENGTSRSQTVSSDNPGSEYDFLVDGAILTDSIKAKVEMDECPPLERCIRIVPHDQNNGAFFIAVLRKLAPLQDASGNNPHQKKKSDNCMFEVSEEKTRAAKDQYESEKAGKASGVQILTETSDGSFQNNHPWAPDDDPQKTNNVGSKPLHLEGEKESGNVAKSRLQIQGKWRGVDPVVLFEDEDVIKTIRTFYGIDTSFPLEGHLVTRNTDSSRVKRIYYISKSVHNVVKLNFKVGQALKITSLGLKIFERQTSKETYASSSCAFRISSEGLPLLLPYIRKQILHASLADFENLLKYRNIKFSEFIDVYFGQKASNLAFGCCVVVLNKGDQTMEDAPVDASTVAIGCWKGKTNLSAMVSPVDSQELLARLSFKHKGSAPVEEKAETGSEENVEEVPEDVEGNGESGDGDQVKEPEEQHDCAGMFQ